MLGKGTIEAAVKDYCIAMQPSSYLAQAALLTLLHRKDVVRISFVDISIMVT
jgi:hypothetical protein